MLGAWLGVVSRAVVGAALEGEGMGMRGAREEGEGVGVGDWNIVQNNGSGCCLLLSPSLIAHAVVGAGMEYAEQG